MFFHIKFEIHWVAFFPFLHIQCLTNFHLNYVGFKYFWSIWVLNNGSMLKNVLTMAYSGGVEILVFVNVTVCRNSVSLALHIQSDLRFAFVTHIFFSYVRIVQRLLFHSYLHELFVFSSINMWVGSFVSDCSFACSLWNWIKRFNSVIFPLYHFIRIFIFIIIYIPFGSCRLWFFSSTSFAIYLFLIININYCSVSHISVKIFVFELKRKKKCMKEKDNGIR